MEKISQTSSRDFAVTFVILAIQRKITDILFWYKKSEVLFFPLPKTFFLPYFAKFAQTCGGIKHLQSFWGVEQKKEKKVDFIIQCSFRKSWLLNSWPLGFSSPILQVLRKILIGGILWWMA